MCDIYLVCEVIPNVCQGLATHLRRTIPPAIKNCKSRDNPIKATFSVIFYPGCGYLAYS